MFGRLLERVTQSEPEGCSDCSSALYNDCYDGPCGGGGGCSDGSCGNFSYSAQDRYQNYYAGRAPMAGFMGGMLGAGLLGGMFGGGFGRGILGGMLGGLLGGVIGRIFSRFGGGGGGGWDGGGGEEDLEFDDGSGRERDDEFAQYQTQRNLRLDEEQARQLQARRRRYT